MHLPDRGRLPVVALAAAAALGGLAALSGEALAQASYEKQPRAPEFIYARMCGYCHGHNVGPIIRGKGHDPEAIAYFVRNGNNAMPAFRPTEITDAELAALGKWLSASKADPKEHGQ